MKISVSLPDEDLAFLDAYAAEHDYPSRSAALRHAVSLLRAGELAPAYESAWRSWSGSGDAGAWGVARPDGLEGWMRRGEIRVVDFGSGMGTGMDASTTRPAVVVSNDAANAAATRLGRGVITVVPVTPNVDLVHPFQVLLPASDTGLPRAAKAQAEQVRSVAVERVGRRVGVLAAGQIQSLDEALRTHLAL